MQKTLEINIIEDNELSPQDRLHEFGVGDWVLCNVKGDIYLCVIAQVDIAKITLIAFTEADPKQIYSRPRANRMSSPFTITSEYSKLNSDDMKLLTFYNTWTLEKVNVSINVYRKESEPGIIDRIDTETGQEL